MQAKIVKRIFTFHVSDEDGTTRDEIVETVSLLGGRPLSDLTSENAQAAGVARFGKTALLWEVRDVTRVAEVPEPDFSDLPLAPVVPIF